MLFPDTGGLISQLMVVVVLVAMVIKLTLCTKPNSNLHLNLEAGIAIPLVQMQELKLREVK